MKKLILLPLFAFSVLYTSCEKDCLDERNPACSNYDPCVDEIAPDAGFHFYREFYDRSDAIYVPIRDTIYNFSTGGGSLVIFMADDNRMDTYEWSIGFDPRVFTGSRVPLRFTNIDGELSTTLTVQKEIKEECSLEENVTNTKSIHFKVVEDVNDFPIFGSYKGVNEDSPLDTFTVDIVLNVLGKIKNLPMDCTNPLGVTIFLTGRTFYIENQYSCDKPAGTGYLEEGNQKLVIDYSIESGEDGERVSKRFIGTRQ